MTEMSKLEKRFVNRRGTRGYSRLLDRLERAGQFPLPSTSDVLELGAGNGNFSVLLQRRYHPASIHVTDFDPEQVALARQNLEVALVPLPPTIVVEQGDASRLQYPDQSFDLVVAHQVLHHLGGVPEILRGVDEIARVLRPGGRLLYVEMFHKRAVRERLAHLGFRITFRARALRFFATADVVVAVRPPKLTAVN
jgi:ubiquinone/menaquinone biosynthesis C-methylase UbiE